jgi:hypothetical protein
VYEFCVESNNEGCTVPYYRYTAKAITKNIIEQLVSRSSIKTATKDGQTTNFLPIEAGAR